MSVRIYGIRNCDTMKKAFAWLDDHGVEYEFHDYKKLGAPADKLAAWVKQVGWERLINARGPTWRKIPEAKKQGLTASRALALLGENSSAIKRPIVEAGSRLLVGFDPEEFKSRLKA
jgi:Spx/MgsR family transcriptional regulator